MLVVQYADLPVCRSVTKRLAGRAGGGGACLSHLCGHGCTRGPRVEHAVRLRVSEASPVQVAPRLALIRRRPALFATAPNGPVRPFDGDVLVLNFTVRDIVGGVVEAELHAHHLGVAVPSHGLEVLGPHGLALHGS